MTPLETGVWDGGSEGGTLSRNVPLGAEFVPVALMLATLVPAKRAPTRLYATTQHCPPIQA